MKRILGIILIVFIIAVMAFLILVIKLYWPHRVYLDKAIRCVYHYEYFDENDVVRQDVVEIASDDVQILADLITGKPFREAIDLEKGFTEDYALEFLNENGESVKILIQYGRDGRIRLDKSNWDYVLDGGPQSQLYSILEGYHRYAGVLLAG